MQVEKKIVEDATHFQSYLGDPEDKSLQEVACTSMREVSV